ncbi:MAG: sigma-70 family RNA polymerase sigma factor [Verrucomicrobiota bacterium]
MNVSHRIAGWNGVQLHPVVSLVKRLAPPKLPAFLTRPSRVFLNDERALHLSNMARRVKDMSKGDVSKREAAAMNADDLIPTRQSLLSRLKDWEDDVSWKDFFDTYWKLIYGTARRAGLQPNDAEEVVQETFISVSKAIRNFEYDPQQGSFKGWLRTTTTWRIQDRIRKRQREQAKDALHVWPAQHDGAIAEDWDEEWEKALAEAAIDRVKKQVAPKHFQIFDLATMKQWPTSKVAKTLSVRASYVYLVKHRVAARVRAELKKLRRAPCEGIHSPPGSMFK